MKRLIIALVALAIFGMAALSLCLAEGAQSASAVATYQPSFEWQDTMPMSLSDTP